jgi:hypothetical protein
MRTTAKVKKYGSNRFSGREKVYFVPSRLVVTFADVGHRLKVGIVEIVKFISRELRIGSVTVNKDRCSWDVFINREVLS